MNFRISILLSLVFLFSVNKIFATIYEAEDAVLYNAVTETEHSGYSGEGYVNFDNETGSYIEFSISMAESGTQTLSFHYANGGTAARPMAVNLNGSATGLSANFIVTGAWTTWQTEALSLDLVKGLNTVRLTSSASDGGPNLDYVDVSGTAGSQYTLSITVNGPGTVLTDPEGTTFYEGETVTLTASTGLFGVFDGWTGDVNSTDPEIEILMDSDKSLVASFHETEVTVPDPDFDMIGFATISAEGYNTTTGGEGGTVTIVTTLQELLDFASSRENETSPAILYIRGKISAESTTVVTIKHGANITILGEGTFGELENVGLNIRDYNNVIIRNMKIHEVLYPNDAITIDECQHVWVDHNELYSKIGSGIGVDTYDGLLDIKNGSRYVTASWNIIHHHMKTSLIGHTDSDGQADTDSQFRITYHHNYFHDTDGRNPSIRFGAIHMFNNYFENISDYGIAVRKGAHALIENNHYHSVVIPITTNKFDPPDGYVCESGTIYTGSCSAADNSITQVDCDFWSDLPYNYELEETNTVALSVQAYAGVGIISTGNTVSLSSISVSDGMLNPSFNSNITHYDLVLPATVTEVTISATTEDEGATINGDGLITTIPSTVEIIVSSADGSMSLSYFVNVSNQVLSSNANLASLTVSTGTLAPEFSASLLSYQLEVPAGTNSVTISAEAEDENATVSGTGAFTDIPGTAEIEVEAENGDTRTYTIAISIAEGINGTETPGISCYPNPVSDYLRISGISKGSLVLYDMSGRVLESRNITSEESMLDMRQYNAGIYLVRITSAEGTAGFRIIKK